jgi:hypothetical protein
VRDPIVLAQVADAEQPPLSVAHSLMSAHPLMPVPEPAYPEEHLQ